ncbi:MAG: tRNA (5-methylaminomethyl-2-thiouridine)(34)-methyltransferase MnmD [Pseudomonadota bacterium]
MPSDRSDAKLRWEDGNLPVSTRFDDPYYARSDGLAESRHVFLDGNELSERFQQVESFSIAEIGFGTGLNFLAAWDLWRRSGAPGKLTFTSFELYPMTWAERIRALANWQELDGLIAEWAECGDDLSMDTRDCHLHVINSDANAQIPVWDGMADAWFLDGFAPARNPELWGETLISQVFARTAPGGTAATYSAAGAVRRALQAAGFDVARRTGFGTKREMLAARRPARGAAE